MKEYITTFGKSPTFKIIAEHFNISDAAVSHRISTLVKNGRLKNISGLGIMLIGSDGKLYQEVDNAFVTGSNIELCLAPPDGYKKMSEDNLLFRVNNDFLEQCSIRNGDFLEVQFIKRKNLQLGDLAILRSGLLFFVKLYLFPQFRKIRNLGISDELLFEKGTRELNIIGCVVRISRQFNCRY